MSSGNDSNGGTMFSAHTTIEAAQSAVTAPEGLSRNTQGGVGALVRLVRGVVRVDVASQDVQRALRFLGAASYPLPFASRCRFRVQEAP